MLRYVPDAAEPVLAALSWPTIKTEKQFIQDLATVCNTIWDMYSLKNHVVGMCMREVTDRVFISSARLRELDEERLQQLAMVKFCASATMQEQASTRKRAEKRDFKCGCR